MIIGKFITQICPPKHVDGARHRTAEEWRNLESNEHFKHRSGNYTFGIYAEQGHNYLEPILSKDICSLPPRKWEVLKKLLDSLGWITEIISAALLVLQPEMYHQMREAVKGFCQRDVAQMSTIAEEIFSLRVIVINLTTTEHVDRRDWEGGLTWLSTFGEFNGGDISCGRINRTCSAPTGTFVGMIASKIPHKVEHWGGTQAERYSLVNVFHNELRPEIRYERKTIFINVTGQTCIGTRAMN